MDIEEFALGDSLIHRLDPRVKIAMAAIYSVIVALSGSVHAAAVSICFPVILILLGRLSLRRILRRLAVVNAFVLFLWVFLPFTYPGKIVYSLGPLDVHRQPPSGNCRTGCRVRRTAPLRNGETPRHSPGSRACR